MYSNWLKIPAGSFRFVPVQAPHTDITESEDRESPFLLAMRAARRDYGTLFTALEGTRTHAIIVAPPHALEGLRIPNSVRVASSATREECHSLLQRARLHVIPIRNPVTGSGQVTLVDSMAMGRRTIVMACPATIDYAQDEAEVIFAPPLRADTLRAAIARLWSDDGLRERLSRQARAHALTSLSDEAIAKQLNDILDFLAFAR